MKKITSYIAMLLTVALLMQGCGETEPTIYDGDIFISFLSDTTGRYVVQANNAPYTIEIGIPYPSKEDITVNLVAEYASGQEGIHYTLPGTVRIPEGEVTASFNVNSNFTSMIDRQDTLVIALDHENAANFANRYTLVIQPPCEFVLEEFIGEYTVFELSDYEDEPYEPYVIEFTENPNGGDTLIVNGMWPGYPFKIVFNTDNAPDYRFNIPDQFLVADLQGYGETRISDQGAGVVLTCEHTLTIRYEIYVSAGYFEQALITFVKNP